MSSILLFASCVPGLDSEKKKTDLKFEQNSPAGMSGATKAASLAAFKVTVYPLVRTMTCVNCHGDAKKYQPYYAVSDADSAWQALVVDSKKVNLENPEASRIYLRIKNDLHNCLTGTGDADCNSEAETMLAAIKKWKEMAKVTDGSGVKTESIAMASATVMSSETENGTLLLEAEQDDFATETMIGRFNTDQDGQASGFKYALTAIPPINPTTMAARTPVFAKGSACEVTTSTMLSNSLTGPYQIAEEGTHINSGAVTPSGLSIKDGQRPFSVSIKSALIRPDKRMSYAKMLTGWSAGVASGTTDIKNIPSLLINNNIFDFENAQIDVSSKTRTPSAIDITNVPLTGDPLQAVSFKTLPYFLNKTALYDSLADTATLITDPNLPLQTHRGTSIKLKDTYKLPIEAITASEILQFFEKNESDSSTTNKFRKDLMYKFITENMDALFTTTTNKYTSIQNMDSTHLYSLYGDLKINVKACPGGACTSSTQDLEITSGTDVDGVALTYDNALDILKVNNTGNRFVAGTTAELQAGKAFRRIDLYTYNFEDVDGKKYGDSFEQTFYSHSAGSFSQKSRITFPIARPVQNINLKALYASGANTLSRNDSLANFQSTLFPIMQKMSCVNCHSGTQAARVQHSNSNPIVAFNEIERAKLINFTTPTNSLRRAIFPAESKIAHNCPDSDPSCSATQAEIIRGINLWNAANVVSQNASAAQTYQELSEKERSPGMLQYTFKATKTGVYNIWTKVKSTNNFRINLRVMDGTTALPSFSKIQSPTQGASCVAYTFPEITSWTWFTPGRADDLTKVDARGVLKKNNNGALLTLSDNRTYWKLEANKTYTLQIFEAAASTKIDSIAIDYVANFADLLDFQPDLLARDENNIADYKKKVLSYDISNLVGMTAGKAYFNVEVKTALSGQNYIFRNPRVVSPDANIDVKGIKVYINGTHAYSDASWDKIDFTTGDNKVMTYAPLTTLVQNGPASDTFQFSFEKLGKSTKILADINPRGAAPIIVNGRSCRELDLFINTVKPILRSARLMLKDEGGYNSYVRDFPGSNRARIDNSQIYQCMGCHNDSHPYFKMTTFDYPEILCAQALSRVDFSNYRDSLLVRGIDGSGTHPKLHFIEELEYNAAQTSVIDYNQDDGTRILSGSIKNLATADSRAIFSKWISGTYFSTYSNADLGLGSSWSGLSDAQKNLARNYVGQLKRINYTPVPNLTSSPFYEPFIHDPLIGKTLLENDDLTTGVLQRTGVNVYTTFIPTTSTTLADYSARSVDLIVVKDGNKLRRTTGNQKVFNTTKTTDEINEKFEAVKAQYRDVILKWIAKEHQHVKNGT